MRYLIVLIILLLQGCAGAMIAAGVAGMATVEVTGKSVSDHAISAYNNKDCKMSRKMQGKDVCQDQPDTEPDVVAAKPNPASDVPIESPPPKKIVVVSTSVDDMESVFAQRKAAK